MTAILIRSDQRAFTTNNEMMITKALCDDAHYKEVITSSKELLSYISSLPAASPLAKSLMKVAARIDWKQEEGNA
ncbi:MAG: hypothetical protein NTV33_10925 [Coprothermobacterota bacterium]|nr:hypothetical protein [Coprothermobacterota bacterium]